MIDEKTYNYILEHYYAREEIAKENKIPLSFLYSRLAMEGKIKYNSKEYLKNKEII